MGIRTYKPTSAGRRNSSVSDFAEITDKNKKPEKKLTEPKQKTGGRNHQGFITSRHRGGGHKRKYRIIDWVRNDRDGQAADRYPYRVRPQSIGADRTREVRGWREALLAGARWTQGRHDGYERPRRRAQAGQLPAAVEDSIGVNDPQHRDAARRRRQTLPVGRGRGDLDGPRGKLGPDHPPVGRSSAHPRRMPSHDRHGRKSRSHERPAG